MSHQVLKPFASTLRRFAVGASVSEADDLAPHTIESLQAAGVLAGGKAPAEVAATPNPIWPAALKPRDA